MTSPIPAPGFDVFSSNCPSRRVMQHITGRWGALVLVALAGGPLRFTALRRRIEGISDRILAQTLQQLEADGMLLREDKGTAPPHVEYRLTVQGLRVAPRLVDLMATLEEVMPEVVARQGG